MNGKSKQEEYAEQIHISLLTNALERAKANSGVLLNGTGKIRPQLYLKGTTVTSFNSLILALHSDENGYKTNLYTPFSEARKRNDAILSGQKGVPFVWYSWNQYQNKANENERISRNDYLLMSQKDKEGYKPVRVREVRTLFNLEQTTMPYANPIEFEDAVKVYGHESSRNFTEMDDKRRRMNVNQFIQNVKANLVSVRKDGTGIARYDSAKDLVFIPAQKHFNSYADYVQEAVRNIATATGHPQRLSRQGTQIEGTHGPTEIQAVREKLIVELTSAVKMMQFGLPAKISDSNIPLIDSWKELIKTDPHFIDAIEAEVNNSLSMMAKAEQGEKVELTPVVNKENTNLSGEISAKLFMVKDDNSKWMLFIKPENEKGFAVYPDKDDVNRFFVTARQGNGMLVERVRQELAQKYYSLTESHPDLKVDLFNKAKADIDLSLIERVNVFKTKDNSKILCLPTIQGAGKITPRELTPMQWQLMWIADDKQEYKQNLAASLFSDVIREVQQKQKAEQLNEDNSRGCHR